MRLENASSLCRSRQLLGHQTGSLRKRRRFQGAARLGKSLKYMPHGTPRRNIFAITQENLWEQLHLLVTMEHSGAKHDPSCVKRLSRRVSHLESSGYFSDCWSNWSCKVKPLERIYTLQHFADKIKVPAKLEALQTGCSHCYRKVHISSSNHEENVLDWGPKHATLNCIWPPASFAGEATQFPRQ